MCCFISLLYCLFKEVFLNCVGSYILRTATNGSDAQLSLPFMVLSLSLRFKGPVFIKTLFSEYFIPLEIIDMGTRFTSKFVWGCSASRNAID